MKGKQGGIGKGAVEEDCEKEKKGKKRAMLPPL